jgi:hypothetical protein
VAAMNYTVYDSEGKKIAEVVDLLCAVTLCAVALGEGATVRLRYRRTIVLFTEKSDAFDGFDECELEKRVAACHRALNRLREIGVSAYRLETGVAP